MASKATNYKPTNRSNAPPPARDDQGGISHVVWQGKEEVWSSLYAALTIACYVLVRGRAAKSGAPRPPITKPLI